MYTCPEVPGSVASRGEDLTPYKYAVVCRYDLKHALQSRRAKDLRDWPDLVKQANAKLGDLHSVHKAPVVQEDIDHARGLIGGHADAESFAAARDKEHEARQIAAHGSIERTALFVWSWHTSHIGVDIAVGKLTRDPCAIDVHVANVEPVGESDQEVNEKFGSEWRTDVKPADA